MSRFQVTFLHPRYWLTWLGLSIFRLLIMLPYPVLLIMGKCVGLLIYRVGGLRRRIARQNLELCFPDSETKTKDIKTLGEFSDFSKRFEQLKQILSMEHKTVLDHVEIIHPKLEDKKDEIL